MRAIGDLIANINNGGNAAHAYILEGKPAARRQAFIRRLTEGLGCHSLDVVSMQMSGKTGYRADDANEFAERLGMGAYGSCLVGLIDDADSMSEIVQNKLLKTLEEPQGNVIIILGTSNRDHLLDTVRSRCSVIRAEDYEDAADADDEEYQDAIMEAAELLAGGCEFFRFREAAGKSVKTKADALAVIDLAEDRFRERMLEGSEPAAMAEAIGLAEKARMDTARGMDRNKALKRLFLELTTVR